MNENKREKDSSRLKEEHFGKDTFHKVTTASREYGKDSGGHESKRV